MKKRVLSIILFLGMVCTLLSVGAFAANIIGSGACGANLTWALDSAGTLIINGTGDMYEFDNYYTVTSAPWGIYAEQIKTVEIGNGVTSICDGAFEGCSNLESVSIGNSVTRIGDGAFSGCLLKSATIPDSVTSIGNYAFYICDNLVNINIPNNVTSIGDSAFKNCRSLESITIPDGVTSIGDSVFSGCCSLESVTIPNSVTSIGDGAFSGCLLKSVTIPDSVTSIGGGAFSECYNLESVTIPNSVTSIGYGAFYICDNLVDITIPNNVTNIGDYAFSRCNSLESVTISDSVTSIGDYAFSECKSLESVTIPNSVMSIGYSAFSFCSSLECATFMGNAPEKFRSNVFNGCADDFTIYVPANNTTWTGSGAYNVTTCTWNQYPVVFYQHQHNYTAVVTDPTCTDKGYMTYICACGDSYVADYKDALGHDYGAWTVTTAPTCTEKGVETRYCSRCDATETREVAVLGHNYVDGVCTRCGDKDPDYKPPVQENPFTDVSADSVYYDAILWAYYHTPQQITGGYGNNDFRPQATCNRGQVVTFLWRAAGCPEPASSENPFPDVENSGACAPYYKAILWAVEKGITNGFEDGTFRPFDPVTRAQFVTFLWRFEGKPATSGSINGFADAAEIAAPYQPAVAWAVEKGITLGYAEENGTFTFRPTAECTRWAVVLFMHRDLA